MMPTTQRLKIVQLVNVAALNMINVCRTLLATRLRVIPNPFTLIASTTKHDDTTPMPITRQPLTPRATYPSHTGIPSYRGILSRGTHTRGVGQ